MNQSSSQAINHTWSSKINYLKLKHKLTFIFSLGVMLWGLYGLGQQVQLVVKISPLISSPQSNIANQSFDYNYLLQFLLFISVVNFVTTAYGLALLIKPTNLVKTAHIIVGLLIIVINYVVHNYFNLSPQIAQLLLGA